MSNPGPASPARARRCEACPRRSVRYRRFARSASTAVPARSTPSSGRTGPGNRRCSGSRAGSSLPTRAPSSIGETERRRVSPAESRRLGLGIAYQTYSHVLHLSVAENLYLAAPSDLRPTYGRMDRMGGRPAGRVRARHLAGRAHGSALARGETAPRGRQGAARPAEGVAPRRADDGPRARGRRPSPRTGSRAEPRRRRDRLRQPPAARGPRHRRPDQRSPRRRVPGDVRGRLDVGGEPRRAHDRASAPARVSAATRA